MKKKLFQLSMYLFCWALTIVLYLTFLQAYFSGKMQVTVKIDAFGEAIFEAIALTVIVLLATAALAMMLTEWKEVQRKQRN